jgi:hypothetical protein
VHKARAQGEKSSSGRFQQTAVGAHAFAERAQARLAHAGRVVAQVGFEGGASRRR